MRTNIRTCDRSITADENDIGYRIFCLRGAFFLRRKRIVIDTLPKGVLRRSRVGDMTSVQYYVPKGKIVLLLFFTVHYKEGEKREKSFSATGLVGFSNVEVHTTHLPICSIAERSQKQGNQLTLPEKSAAGRRRRSSNLRKQFAKFIFFSIFLIFFASSLPHLAL